MVISYVDKDTSMEGINFYGHKLTYVDDNRFINDGITNNQEPELG